MYDSAAGKMIWSAHFWTVSICIVLYCIVSYRIVSYRIVLYCIVLYCNVKFFLSFYLCCKEGEMTRQNVEIVIQMSSIRLTFFNSVGLLLRNCKQEI